MKKKLQVLCITHAGHIPPEGATDESAKGQNWKMEHHVLTALAELGHTAELLGVHDELAPKLWLEVDETGAEARPAHAVL